MSMNDRKELFKLFLRGTVNTVSNSNKIKEIIIVSSDRFTYKLAKDNNLKIISEEKDEGVNSAVKKGEEYCNNNGADASIVIPYDLPLIRPIDLDVICECITRKSECIVICPSLKLDGTNILLRRPASLIHTYYDNNSFENHFNVAKTKKLMKLFFSLRTSVDIDTPLDLKFIGSNKLLSKIVYYETRTFLESFLQRHGNKNYSN